MALNLFMVIKSNTTKVETKPPDWSSGEGFDNMHKVLNFLELCVDVTCNDGLNFFIELFSFTCVYFILVESNSIPFMIDVIFIRD
jgi:hypothetical protein